MDRACHIGAGSSGLVAAQVLSARGIPIDCFEKGSRLGGNRCYQNDHGLSSAYESLRVNSSRTQTQFAAYPMPADYPDYRRTLARDRGRRRWQRE